MTEQKESAADKAIREALESVERLERERKTATATPSDDDVAFAPDDAADTGGNFQTTPPAPAEPAPEAPKKKTADQLMVESLLKAKGEMQNALEQTQKEAKDMFERLARVSADFEIF
jgi:hypothetical protein